MFRASFGTISNLIHQVPLNVTIASLVLKSELLLLENRVTDMYINNFQLIYSHGFCINGKRRTTAIELCYFV